MELFVVFGLPGAGKTFVGKIMQKDFGFYTFEADQIMPKELQQTIRKQEVVSDDLRNTFFDQIIAQTRQLQTEHEKIVITQVFIKEKYREQFLKEFPEAKFILVEASDEVREERLMHQQKWQLDLDYWRKMADLFDQPEIEHEVVTNNDGEEKIKEQLRHYKI